MYSLRTLQKNNHRKFDYPYLRCANQWSGFYAMGILKLRVVYKLFLLGSVRILLGKSGIYF